MTYYLPIAGFIAGSGAMFGAGAYVGWQVVRAVGKVLNKAWLRMVEPEREVRWYPSG